MRASAWILAMATGALLMAGGCGGDKKAPATRGEAELGEPCKQTRECRQGLICMGGTCAPRNAQSTPKELEKAYELNEDRSQGAIDKYSPYQRAE